MMENRRNYERLTMQIVQMECDGQLLFQSGALGARMKVEAEVDPWIDANGGDQMEVKLNNGTPFEF